MQMPEMNGLELVAAARAEFPGLPVILTTGAGSEELAVQGAAGRGRQLHPQAEPRPGGGAAAWRRYSRSPSRSASTALFLGRMTAVDHSFALENDPDLVPEVVGHVEALMRQMELFDPSDRVRIGVGVHEAVVNAMVHGNLEVGSDLKCGDWQAYHALIRERARQEPYRDRRVWVLVRADRSPLLRVAVPGRGAGVRPAGAAGPDRPGELGEGLRPRAAA